MSFRISEVEELCWQPSAPGTLDRPYTDPRMAGEAGRNLKNLRVSKQRRTMWTLLWRLMMAAVRDSRWITCSFYRQDTPVSPGHGLQVPVRLGCSRVKT